MRTFASPETHVFRTAGFWELDDGWRTQPRHRQLYHTISHVAAKPEVKTRVIEWDDIFDGDDDDDDVDTDDETDDDEIAPLSIEIFLVSAKPIDDDDHQEKD